MLGASDRCFVLIQSGDGNADGWYGDHATDHLGRIAGFSSAAGLKAYLSRGDTGCCVLPPGHKTAAGSANLAVVDVRRGGVGSALCVWGRDNEELESGTRDAGRADDIYGDRDGDVRLNPADCDGFSDGELGASTQQIGP